MRSVWVVLLGVLFFAAPPSNRSFVLPARCGKAAGAGWVGGWIVSILGTCRRLGWMCSVGKGGVQRAREMRHQGGPCSLTRGRRVSEKVKDQGASTFGPHPGLKPHKHGPVRHCFSLMQQGCINRVGIKPPGDHLSMRDTTRSGWGKDSASKNDSRLTMWG